MSMGSNPTLKRYVRKIRKMIPCSGNMKRSIMSQISESIEDYLRQNPDADMEAIQTHFGTPLEIAASCVEGRETVALVRKFRARKKALSITAAAMAVMFLICAGVVARNAHLNRISDENGAKVIIVDTFNNN